MIRRRRRNATRVSSPRDPFQVALNILWPDAVVMAWSDSASVRWAN